MTDGAYQVSPYIIPAQYIIGLLSLWLLFVFIKMFFFFAGVGAKPFIIFLTHKQRILGQLLTTVLLVFP
jgi:hypothetical protein